ncbi:hypothetical protein BDZ89DRAFT_1161981 [Hymenopellis radicata]|nr:hypothetical protein BDZ89DRAFT_1161981 [Hymenopellis radicata]
MAPIRSHTKSRNGCRSCRTRKVKCDEKSPICTNCTNRQIECVWNDTKTPQSSPEATTSALIPSSMAVGNVLSGTSNFTLDLMALELMHHYMDSTCYTMSLEPSVVHIYKTIVPTMAFSANCTFLLHSLLSFSALHLYSLHGSTSIGAKYAYAASSYHVQAKNSLPSISHLPPGANPNVVYMTESFLMAYAFLVSPSLWEDVDSMATVRFSDNPKAGLAKWKAYNTPELAPLFAEYRAMDIAVSLHLAANAESDSHFPPSLSSIHLPTSGAPDPEEVRDPLVSAMYERAVRYLRRTWVASLYPEHHKQAAALWFIFMPDTFMNLLVERKPRALVLASHYCAIMRRMNGPWWMQRKWTEEMEDIARTVGEEWRAWMDWIPPEDGVFAHLGLEEGTDLYAWLSSDATCSPTMGTMHSSGNTMEQ